MALLRKLTTDQRRTVGHWVMELAIVVAGVLIALWLQQWGDRRRALDDMKVAEEAIHDEVRATLTSLIWREAISKCHFERADRLKSMLLRAQSQWPGINENALLQNTIEDATGIPTVVPSVYQRPGDAFSMAAWNSAMATGALAPMNRQRFGRLVGLYDQIQLLSKNQDREDRAAATLSALAFPQELTPETRTRMLEALYEIDRTRFMFGLAGRFEFPQGMRELGWNDKAEIDRWIRDDAAEARRQGVRWRSCVAPARNPFAGEPPQPVRG